MTPRAVAVELQQAAEHLQRAALAAALLDPEFSNVAVIWSREVDDLIERSLEFVDRAIEADCRTREGAAA